MASRKGSEEEEDDDEEEEERGVGRSLGPIIENAAGPRRTENEQDQNGGADGGGVPSADSVREEGLPWPAVRHAIRQKVARAGETVGKTKKKEADDTDGKNETRMRETE